MRKGKFTVLGKEHNCEVGSDGVPKVDGMSVDDFVETLSESELLEFARLGARARDIKKSGRKAKPGELQAIANRLI